MDNDENNNQPPPPTSVYPHNSANTTVIPPPPTSGSTSIIPGVGATYNHQQQQHLQYFWSGQRQDIERVNDFKNHQLPLARIKKIMKADEDVRMISAEAPILFAKACELFILELTIRSWHHAEENKRRTLQKNDIAASITRTEIFDFLVDIVPREEIKEEEDAAAAAALGGGSMVAQAATGVPYYFPPMGVPGGMMIGRPAMDPTGFYAQPPSHAWQNSGGGGGGGSGVDDVSYGSGASNNGGHGNLDSQI